jgi:hypothetical protein
MTLKQVRNNTVSEIAIYSGMFTVSRFLPGLNMLPKSEFDLVSEHPAFKNYLVIKELVLIPDSKDHELEIDSETNLTIEYDVNGEPVPVTESRNKEATPLLAKGRTFSIAKLKAYEIPRDVAKKIMDNQSTNGWFTVEQLREAAGVENGSEVAGKLEELFNNQ